MLVLLPPPMSTYRCAAGANRPFLPDLLPPVLFCLIILFLCFSKLPTMSFQTFMKCMAWLKQKSVRPVSALPCTLLDFVPWGGFFLVLFAFFFAFFFSFLTLLSFPPFRLFFFFLLLL